MAILAEPSLAKASLGEILRMSEPWFGAFRDDVEYWCHAGRELRKQIRKVVGCEYVALSWLSPAPFRHPRDELPIVSPIPNDVLYDDVYEITASGCSYGAYLSICKSIAEPFTQSERAEAIICIEREFFANAASDGHSEGTWQINPRVSEDPRVIEFYVEPVKRRRTRSSSARESKGRK